MMCFDRSVVTLYDMQSHNDALDDHRRIRMDEYKRDYRKLETRYCEKHPKHVYSMACTKCAMIFCANCTGKIDTCSDGEFVISF